MIHFFINHTILKDNSLVQVNNIIQLPNKFIKFNVKTYLKFKEFTSNPCTSLDVGIFFVNTNDVSDCFYVSLVDIKYKCFVVKMSNVNSVFISLCHELF